MDKSVKNGSESCRSKLHPGAGWDIRGGEGSFRMALSGCRQVARDGQNHVEDAAPALIQGCHSAHCSSVATPQSAWANTRARGLPPSCFSLIRTPYVTKCSKSPAIAACRSAKRFVQHAANTATARPVPPRPCVSPTRFEPLGSAVQSVSQSGFYL